LAAPSRKPPGAFSKLLSAANDEWRATPFYRLTLGGSDPDQIRQWGKDPRAGDPRRGEEILRGRWRIGAERLARNYSIPWSAPPPSLHFAARLHSFSWLGDVAAVGGTAGVAIIDYISSWNEGFGDWHAEAWAPELTAERLFAWLCHGRSAFENGDPTARPALMRSFGRQAGADQSRRGADVMRLLGNSGRRASARYRRGNAGRGVRQSVSVRWRTSIALSGGAGRSALRSDRGG
jgi:uncharacterized heparinase superfamily protein